MSANQDAELHRLGWLSHLEPLWGKPTAPLSQLSPNTALLASSLSSLQVHYFCNAISSSERSLVEAVGHKEAQAMATHSRGHTVQPPHCTESCLKPLLETRFVCGELHAEMKHGTTALLAAE